jgi:hypothetical protein
LNLWVAALKSLELLGVLTALAALAALGKVPVEVPVEAQSLASEPGLILAGARLLRPKVAQSAQTAHLSPVLALAHLFQPAGWPTRQDWVLSVLPCLVASLPGSPLGSIGLYKPKVCVGGPIQNSQ